MQHSFKSKCLAICVSGTLLLATTVLSQNTSCPGSLGPNVFPDGTMGTGVPNVLPFDPGIAPGYAYSQSPPPVDGTYCLANSTAGWTWFAELFWLDIGDNDPDSNGYMMVVNADYQPGVFYHRTVNVCENTPYIFSADIVNLFLPQFPDAILPNVDFLINGNVVFSTGNIPMDMQWHTYEFAFTPPSGASQFSFSLRNNAPGGFGNDLALDNISLRFCGPKITLPQTLTHCDGTLVLQPEFEGNPWQNAFYQWQTSFDNGQTWTNLPGANGTTFHIPNPQSGQQFRLLMAGAQVNLVDPFCRAVSNPVLIQQPVNQGFAQQTICQGEQVAVAGQTFSQTGIYEIPLTASNGCDSLLSLDLTVLPTSSTSLEAEICEGETLHFGNQALTASGTYSQQLTNSVGCDSLVSLQLIVHPKKTMDVAVAICEGDAYFFAGQMQTVAGDYLEHLQTSFGCDSTTVLHLKVLPKKQVNLAVEICNGTTYPFGNQQLSTSGTYQQALQTWTGCDSLVTLVLDILPEKFTPLEAEICQGDSYQFGSQNLHSAGVYHQNLTSYTGCDSMVELNLIVKPALHSEVSANICSGEAYLFDNQQLTASGEYLFQLTSSSGCDSLVTVELTVLPSLTTVLNAQICEDETYQFGGQLLTTAGHFEHLLAAKNGCDSLVSLDLVVLPKAKTSLTAQICQGEIFAFGNEQLTAPGQFFQHLLTWQGCDSLVELDLSVLPIFTTDLMAETCEGELFQGIFFLSDTLLIDTLQASIGCDSIVRTHLTVRSIVQDTIFDFRCWGEEFAGKPVYTDTTMVLAGQTSHGCDSFTVCMIEVGAKFSVEIEGPNAICAYENAELKVSGFQNYFWSTGDSVAQIVVNSAENYRVTVTNSESCTASADHALSVSNPKMAVEMVEPRCHGEANGEIHFSFSNGIEPYRISCNGDGFSERHILHGLSAGVHHIVLIDSLLCELSEEVYLPAPPVFEVFASESQTIDLGETVTFDVQGTLPIAVFNWSPKTYLDCTDCPNPTATPFSNTNYHLLAKNANGCEAESTVSLVVQKEDDVYVPTAFSPNGDGINDFFTLYPGRSVLKIKQLQIFDRWGEQVFGVWNAPPNHPTTHWHGEFRQMPAQVGMYVWMAEIEYIDGGSRLLKGEVNLLR